VQLPLLLFVFWSLLFWIAALRRPALPRFPYHRDKARSNVGQQAIFRKAERRRAAIGRHTAQSVIELQRYTYRGAHRSAIACGTAKPIRTVSPERSMPVAHPRPSVP